jgi:hypothetical protein
MNMRGKAEPVLSLAAGRPCAVTERIFNAFAGVPEGGARAALASYYGAVTRPPMPPIALVCAEAG